MILKKKLQLKFRQNKLKKIVKRATNQKIMYMQIALKKLMYWLVISTIYFYFLQSFQ